MQRHLGAQQTKFMIVPTRRDNHGKGVALNKLITTKCPAFTDGDVHIHEPYGNENISGSHVSIWQPSWVSPHSGYLQAHQSGSPFTLASSSVCLFSSRQPCLPPCCLAHPCIFAYVLYASSTCVGCYGHRLDFWWRQKVSSFSAQQTSWTLLPPVRPEGPMDGFPVAHSRKTQNAPHILLVVLQRPLSQTETETEHTHLC